MELEPNWKREAENAPAQIRRFCRDCKHCMPIEMEENQPNELYPAFCRKYRKYLTADNKQFTLWVDTLCEWEANGTTDK